MQQRSDGGGIYTLSTQGNEISWDPDPSDPDSIDPDSIETDGLVISGNAVLDQGWGYNAYYFDQGSGWITATGNLAFNNDIRGAFDIGANLALKVPPGNSHVAILLFDNLLQNKQLTNFVTPPLFAENQQISGLTNPGVSTILNNAGLQSSYTGNKDKVVYNDELSGRLGNVSTRAHIDAGHWVYGGFVIEGGSRKVLIRGVGPELSNFGVDPYAADPETRLYNAGSSTPSHSNDNWGSESATQKSDAALDVGAFSLHTGSKDAALLVTLDAGAYSVAMNPRSGTSGGDALLEVYEVDYSSTPLIRFTNGSGFCVIPQNGSVIQGFRIQGNTSKRVIIRAAGPTLAQDFGVSGAVAQPPSI